MTFTFAASLVQVLLTVVSVAVFGFDDVSKNWTGGPGPCALWRLGGRFKPDIVQGEVWRLLAPVFLHSGVVHLFMNVSAQLVIGMQAEFKWGMQDRFDANGDVTSASMRWGTVKVVAVYIVSGVAANIVSCVAEPPDKAVLSVGASGAVLGLVGGEIAFLCSTWARWEAHQRLERIRGIGICIFLVFFVGLVAPLNADNWAHFGGLFSGLALGLAVHMPNFAGRGKFVAGAVAFLAAAGAVVVTVALFTANFGTRTDDATLTAGLRPTVCYTCNGHLTASEKDTCQ